MNDKRHLVSNRAAQNLSRPAVFIKDAQENQAQTGRNNSSSKKNKSTQNKHK